MTIPFDDIAAEWMKDPEYAKAYEALEDEFALIAEMVKARKRHKLSQAQIAELMGTTQSAVARIESGKAGWRAGTIFKYAKATGHEVRLQLVPIGSRRAASRKRRRPQAPAEVRQEK